MMGAVSPALARLRRPAVRPPSRIELALAVLALLAVTAVAYGGHVASGGLYSDDWSNAADFVFADSPRYFTAVGIEAPKLGARPLLAALLPVPAALFGTDPTAWIAFGLGLALLMAACLYLVLRALGLRWPHALAVTALTLVFAPSDATRLWPTAALNNVAVILFLVGFLVSLHAFSHRGFRGIALHAIGLGLFLASVATYEVAGVLMLVCGAFYLLRATPRPALRRWAIDVGVLVVALLVSAEITSQARYVADLDYRLDDAVRVAKGSARVLASTLTPFGVPDRFAALPVLAALAALVFRRPTPGSTADSALRRWGVRTAVAAVIVAAALVPLAGSGIGAAAPGVDNRGNLLAGPALVGLAYMLLAACAVAVAAALRPGRWRLLATIGFAGCLLIVAAGTWTKLGRDKQAWARSADEQQRILAAIHDAVGRPPRGTTVYTFGHAGEVAPGVPVFRQSWDLWGAIRLRYDDDTLSAMPILTGTEVICGARGLYPKGGEHEDLGPGYFVAYGKVIFVDIPTRSAERVDDRATCRAGVRRLQPGAARAV
jgi:hypothetical protein